MMMRAFGSVSRGNGRAEAVALELLKGAEAHERAGRTDKALADYETGLAALLDVLKAESNEAKRRALTQQIEDSMSRAEGLKKKKTRAERGPPVFVDHVNYSSSKGAAKAQLGPDRRRVTHEKTTTTGGRGAGPATNDLEQQVVREMLDRSPGVRWDDVAGLAAAKRTLQEAVVLPYCRPDLYRGLRAPPKGVLLFGPPGTGKTMLARAVSSESKCAFFAVSASSLTSKWLGEAEKLVRALFSAARKLKPAVIFLDELDALLSSRGASSEHEASRRLKTEFLVQLDGIISTTAPQGDVAGGGGLLFMGATNRPWDLDDALLRRVPRRILIPLPDAPARAAFLENLLGNQRNGAVPHALSQRDKQRIVDATDHFSMSDLRSLAEEAALAPLRDLGDRVRHAAKSEVRPIRLADFTEALKVIKPSADPSSLARFDDWAKQFGSRGAS